VTKPAAACENKLKDRDNSTCTLHEQGIVVAPFNNINQLVSSGSAFRLKKD